MKTVSRALIVSALIVPALLSVSACSGAGQEWIDYEQFGAVGDGVHDDMNAIMAAHKAANEKGVPVKLNPGKTYYIGKAAKTAVIRTDVDFSDAKFIIDDVGMDMDSIGSPIFRVDPDEEPFIVEGVTTLKKGQENLGVKLGKRCLVHILNDNKKVYIRYGRNQNNGTSQQEVLIADADGKIPERCGIVWDYDNVTEIKAYPIPDRTLVMKGGTFTTIANQAESKYTYHSRNILVNRSNVRIEGMTHLVTGELDHGAPYSGFISIVNVADVVVSNCVLTAHKTYSTIGSAGLPVDMGSYDLGVNSSVNILFENCTQTTDIDDGAYWGLFGSNFCKEMKMDGCKVSRFDAHMGVENVTLSNCTFGYMGIRSVGFGTMLIENCEIRDREILSLREDYGSCWDGDLIVRNCVLRPLNPRVERVMVLDGSNPGKHDFGYVCQLPRTIVVDGLVIDDSALTSPGYNGPAVLGTFDRDVTQSGLLPYPIPETVSVKNVTVTSGKSLKVSYNDAMFAGLEVSGL